MSTDLALICGCTGLAVDGTENGNGSAGGDDVSGDDTRSQTYRLDLVIALAFVTA